MAVVTSLASGEHRAREPGRALPDGAHRGSSKEPSQGSFLEVEPDEKERVLLVKAIRAPVDVVLPEGCAVLNAEDPEIATMSVKCRGKIVYFARDAEAELVREHLDKGGQAISLAGDTIVVRHIAQLVPILEVEHLHAPIASLLAAVGAGVALGLTQSIIRDGITAALQRESATS